MRLEITQQDIEIAHRERRWLGLAHSCPIYQALAREFPFARTIMTGLTCALITQAEGEPPFMLAYADDANLARAFWDVGRFAFPGEITLYLY